MKYWKIASAATLVLSSSVNAALIDNGSYTTDDVNGIEWLDLDYTASLSYNAAQSAITSVEGGGWTYASEAQVRNMFDQIFPTWVETTAGYSSNTLYTAETDTFTQLFGNSFPTDYYSSDRTFSRGLYMNEVGELHLLGVENYTTGNDYVYGDHQVDYLNFNYDVNGTLGFSVWMVRPSAVPVPAAVWLFGSGLLGLVGIARLKKK